MRLSEFRSLLQCSELDASSTKGKTLSSKSDIHTTDCITMCHSLWWWHIPKQHVTPFHDNVSQDMKRHSRHYVIIWRHCHPLPWRDISRHCVIISRQCHPSPWTDISRHCVIISRQCHPSPWKDISRHCVNISRQCYPLPWTDISRHCVIISRQCHPCHKTTLIFHYQDSNICLFPPRQLSNSFTHITKYTTKLLHTTLTFYVL